MPRNITPDPKPTRTPAETGQRGEPDAQVWPIAGITTAWMNMCMQMWAAWFELWGVRPALRDDGGFDENERRNAGFPWLPKFETTVVPLRRRDDEAGSEAARMSLRVRMPAPPWAGESRSTLAVETLMPRPPRASDLRH